MVACAETLTAERKGKKLYARCELYLENCGYRYDAETENCYVRNRYYSPSLGRWMEQDPAQFINGANTYQFVNSSPVGNVDTEGTWKIARKGGQTAVATSQSGDTIAKLAGTIGLNPAQWRKWSTVVSGDAPSSPAQRLGSGCLKLRIPNTVDIDRGSGFQTFWARVAPADVFYQWRIVSRMLQASYKSAGFYVEFESNVTDGQIALQLEVGTRSKALLGFVSYSHGVSGTINSNGQVGLAPGRYTYYGLAFMALFACETLTPYQERIGLQSGGYIPPNNVSEWATNVAPNGSLEGFTGAAGFNNFVSGLVSVPGVQSSQPIIPDPSALP